MRHLLVLRLFLCLFITSPMVAFAQSTQDQSIPRLITITGVYRPTDGKAPGAVETVTLSVYADQQGGAPLFQETQQVTLDDRGRYSVVLGAAHADGIPTSVFASGQWLGTVFERTGEVEGPRVRLTSVPFAMRAAAADTLGGHPASDYVLATGDSSTSHTSKASDVAAPADEQPGTVNFLAKYVGTTTVGNSALFENNGQVGLGTTVPLDALHLVFNNSFGSMTGLAVQNLGNTANSYSGMLFYDQNNQLGQFQGFNNVTHEYRINNIAKNGANQPNGSINFMIGGASKFFVNSVGNVGIGTTTPSGWLEVSNPMGPTVVMNTTYSPDGFGAYYVGRKARGTPATPAAVQNNDIFLELDGGGYGATTFGNGNSAGISMRAAENWSDTAKGSLMNFSTTGVGSTTPVVRMNISAFGTVGIGATSGGAMLEVSNASAPAPISQIDATTYSGSSPSGTLVSGRKARGTLLAPTAVQNGDFLVGFTARGYGATGFGNNSGGGIFFRAAENWTDAAQGTNVIFNTTAIGTNASATRMTISDFGFVGIGTQSPNGMLDIARNGTSNVIASSYGGQDSGFKAKTARGTIAAPTATQAGDPLAEFTAAGYGATGFNETAGWAAFAVENWTDTAQGTLMGLFATPIGTNEAQPYLVILDNGNVGLSTPQDVNGFPTAADRLQVGGDVRVGTSGTNGCVKNFAGTGIAGTCSSDLRLKKNITPFAPMLDKVTALQPVHYFWRSDEFPARHFGNSQNSGLIAQDVEQVLPELVATDSDGYKAIDYSTLPLLTIQAVKELKSENDARKAENDALKQRVSELERLVTDLLAAARR